MFRCSGAERDDCEYSGATLQLGCATSSCGKWLNTRWMLQWLHKHRRIDLKIASTTEATDAAHAEAARGAA